MQTKNKKKHTKPETRRIDHKPKRQNKGRKDAGRLLPLQIPFTIFQNIDNE